MVPLLLFSRILFFDLVVLSTKDWLHKRFIVDLISKGIVDMVLYSNAYRKFDDVVIRG